MPDFLTIEIKLYKKSYDSLLSTPSLHFIDTGIYTAFFILFKHSATNSGSNIKQAPNLPF